ncbi:hypothetical protein ACM66Z_04270 [Sulfurovum sp. ST-21]|nr:hypothetical protein [Sulfurovum indicum]
MTVTIPNYFIETGKAALIILNDNLYLENIQIKHKKVKDLY